MFGHDWQPPFMSHMIRLDEGEVVKVLADIKHQDAKFDKSDPKVDGANDARTQSRDAFDAALAEPPSAPQP